MHRRLVALTLVLVAVLAGCGDMRESFEMARAVERELSDAHGLDTSVGFNITNGRLQTVSVTFNDDTVRDESVGVLLDEIEPVVVRHFGREPEALVVSFVVRK